MSLKFIDYGKVLEPFRLLRNVKDVSITRNKFVFSDNRLSRFLSALEQSMMGRTRLSVAQDEELIQSTTLDCAELLLCRDQILLNLDSQELPCPRRRCREIGSFLGHFELFLDVKQADSCSGRGSSKETKWVFSRPELATLPSASTEEGSKRSSSGVKTNGTRKAQAPHKAFQNPRDRHKANQNAYPSPIQSQSSSLTPSTTQRARTRRPPWRV